jgi:PPOX class probable F420-dependent enzyme
MNATIGLEAFEGKRYLNLETYRRTGKGVRTPVWFAAAPADGGVPKVYVYTTADAGKAKRIRRTGVVRIAPCDSRGRLTGGWMAARAEIVGPEEYGIGMRLINHKYRPWKQILDWFVRHERVVIAIRPA